AARAGRGCRAYRGGVRLGRTEGVHWGDERANGMVRGQPRRCETFADPKTLAHRIARLHDDWHLDVTLRNLDGRLVFAAGMELAPLPRNERDRVSAGEVVRRSRPEWFTAVLVRSPAGAPLGVLALSAPRRLRHVNLVLAEILGHERAQSSVVVDQEHGR